MVSSITTVTTGYRLNVPVLLPVLIQLLLVECSSTVNSSSIVTTGDSLNVPVMSLVLLLLLLVTDSMALLNVW